MFYIPLVIANFIWPWTRIVYHTSLLWFIGASLSEPHTSETALQAHPTLARLHCARVFICTYVHACGHIPIFHEDQSQACEGYCQSVVSVTRSEDNWNRSMCGNLHTSGLLFYRPSTAGRSQAVQIWTMVEVASGKSHHSINGTRKCQKFSSWFHHKS